MVDEWQMQLILLNLKFSLRELEKLKNKSPHKKKSLWFFWFVIAISRYGLDEEVQIMNLQSAKLSDLYFFIRQTGKRSGT